mgnify:FL=1
MTEIKQLTENKLDDFLILLEEINEKPFEAGTKSRSKEDFARGRYTGFLLYEEEMLAGIAIVIDTYSAVHAKKVLNLDELYVQEQFRKKGFGKKLFDHVIEYAKKEGYMRIEWRAEKNNIATQKLYAQYGAATDWIFYALNL